jgi:hypothetical protein
MSISILYTKYIKDNLAPAGIDHIRWWWIFYPIYWSTSFQAKIQISFDALFIIWLVTTVQNRLALVTGMKPPKVAMVLLLLLCALIYSHQVTSQCTDAQKDDILDKCKLYVRSHASPGNIPAPTSPCCNKVRDVPERDMQCICDRLTAAEKGRNSEQRIYNLKKICEPVPVSNNYNNCRSTILFIWQHNIKDLEI